MVVEKEGKKLLTIPDLVHAMAQFQALYNETQEAIAEIMMEKNLLGLQEQGNAYKKMMDECRAELDKLAIASFKEDGNKRPHPAVGIQERSLFVPTAELPEIKDYVREKLPWFVIVDHKGVLDYAKKNHGTPAALPFFEKKVELRTSLSKDLSEYA